MRTSSVKQLLAVARRAGLRASAAQEPTGWAALRSLATGSEASTTSSTAPPRAKWAAIGFGFAAAALAGGATIGTAAADVSAPPQTVSIGGLKVVASGGATIQKPAVAVAAPSTVVFVLGGPGSGKGTQCARLVEQYDMAHLSAGDLLRAHVKSGTEDGNMVAEMIKQGTIVPSEVTIKLLLAAMAETGKQRFLIDGFPRNRENRDAFERVAGYDCSFVLFFDCPEDVLESRLLGRNEGRTDDNIESIKKRFKVFIESSLPVIEYYEGLGKVHRINTNRPVAEIYADLKALF